MGVMSNMCDLSRVKVTQYLRPRQPMGTTRRACRMAISVLRWSARTKTVLGVGEHAEGGGLSVSGVVVDSDYLTRVGTNSMACVRTRL